MKNEFPKIQLFCKEVANSLYDLEDGTIWIENLEKLFDSYFHQKFEGTQKLGNIETYQNYEVIYKLLFLDFGKICFEAREDFIKFQVQLLENVKFDDNNSLNRTLEITKNFFHQNIFQLVTLLADSIFRLSNIENIQTKKSYQELKDFRDSLIDNIKIMNSQKPTNNLDEQLLIAKIRTAKTELRSKKIKPTKFQVAKLLDISKTTFYERTKKIPFDSL